jgi:ribonuclease R
LCNHCSQREQIIDSAERESDDLVQARFMLGRSGERLSAVISAVLPFGFRVRLKDYFVEGFVHASRLEDDYYEKSDREAALVGRQTGRVYRLGATLEVSLVAAGLESGKIDFVPVVNGVKDTSQRRKKKGARR